jgi:hypothetical protein
VDLAGNLFVGEEKENIVLRISISGSLIPTAFYWSDHSPISLLYSPGFSLLDFSYFSLLDYSVLFWLNYFTFSQASSPATSQLNYSVFLQLIAWIFQLLLLA